MLEVKTQIGLGILGLVSYIDSVMLAEANASPLSCPYSATSRGSSPSSSLLSSSPGPTMSSVPSS